MNNIYLIKITMNKIHVLPGKLDVEKNFTVFQSIKCFNVVPAQLCVPMTNNAFKMNSIKYCIRELLPLVFISDNILY